MTNQIKNTETKNATDYMLSTLTKLSQDLDDSQRRAEALEDWTRQRLASRRMMRIARVRR